jgi:hypothetical protein
MKFDRKCPKCQSTRIGHLETVEDRTHGGSTAQPAAFGRAARPGVFEGARVKPNELWGALEAYVCADCGFYETYVKEPDMVPFDHLEGFSWVNPETEKQGPFR